MTGFSDRPPDGRSSISRYRPDHLELQRPGSRTVENGTHARLHRVQSRLLGRRFDLFGGRTPGRVGVMGKASVEIRPVDDCPALAYGTVMLFGRQFTPSPVVRLCCLERLLREKRVVFDQIVSLGGSLDGLSTEVSACQEHIRPGADGSGAHLGCLFC